MSYINNVFQNFKKNLEWKIGTLGLVLYTISLMTSKFGINFGTFLMLVSFLLLLGTKKINIRNRYPKEIKLMLIYMLLTPIFSLFSIGGISSFLIAFHKLYRYLGIIFIPIFIDFNKKNLKLFYFLYLSIVINFINGILFYYKNNWKFSLRYSSFGGNLLDDAHIFVMLFFIVLSILYYSFYERNIVLFIISFLVLTIDLTAVLLSQARGVWLALIFGLLFYCIITYKNKIIKNKFLFIVLVGIFAFILINGKKIDSINRNRYYKRFISIKKIEEDSPKIRLILWESAVYNYKNNFIFGVGRDNSPKFILKYLDENKKYDEVNSKEALREIAQAGNVHNMYFTSLQEEGILCFLLISVLLCLVWKEYCLLNSFEKKNLEYFLVLGCLCSTLAFCITGLTENSWRNFWKAQTFIFIMCIYQSIKFKIKEKESYEEITNI